MIGDKMKYKTLGNTGCCLGTMTFGDGHGIYQHIGNIGQSDADKLVEGVPAKPRSDNLSKISASTARMLSLPPRSIAARGRAGTMSAHRAPYH
jgi:hypothetical protein